MDKFYFEEDGRKYKKERFTISTPRYTYVKGKFWGKFYSDKEIDKELEYNDVENTKEYNKKIIQLIDEPLIHYQLKELYMQYVNDDDYLQEEIDRLTKLKSK